MPPKARISREDILNAAFDLVREKGQAALNVRAAAKRLGCSTQPVLYNFATVESLKDAVYRKADEFHTAYILPQAGEGADALLQLGLNYVRFGHEEGHLFRFLFESNQFGGMDMNALVQWPGVGELVNILAQGLGCQAEAARQVLPGVGELVNILAQGLGCQAEAARQVFLTFFAVAHGLGSLLANNAMAYDENECAKMLETVFFGALARIKEGEENAETL